MYYPWAAWWWWFAWLLPILLLFWAFSGWSGRRYEYGPGGYSQRRTRSKDDWGNYGVAGHHYRNRGPRNYRRSDDRIYEEVCDRLMASDDVDPSAVDVRVANGEVTLAGTVESRFEKRFAEHIADSVAGVRDVNNQLRIGHVDHTPPPEVHLSGNPAPTFPRST